MCSNISATTVCGEYLSVSCHVFIDRGLLPTMKLQNQGSLDIKMKSSLRKFYYPYHDLVNCHGKYVSQMATDMLFVEVFSFMAYRQIFGMINISVPLLEHTYGTAYPSKGLVHNLYFNWVRVARSLNSFLCSTLYLDYCLSFRLSFSYLYIYWGSLFHSRLLIIKPIVNKITIMVVKEGVKIGIG